ncbi:uncharacterized protein [Acropora muricata]|uniref:uncharacterized protein n=1 Tax=Acropora muricata TaxID=159855 RepID=UPI0034E49D34
MNACFSMVDFLISQGRGEHAAKALPQRGGSVLDDLSFKFISFRSFSRPIESLQINISVASWRRQSASIGLWTTLMRLPPIQIQMQTVAKKLILQLKPETSLTTPMDFKTALNR